MTAIVHEKQISPFQRVNGYGIAQRDRRGKQRKSSRRGNSDFPLHDFILPGRCIKTALAKVLRAFSINSGIKPGVSIHSSCAKTIRQNRLPGGSPLAAIQKGQFGWPISYKTVTCKQF